MAIFRGVNGESESEFAELTRIFRIIELQNKKSLRRRGGLGSRWGLVFRIEDEFVLEADGAKID